MIELERPNRRVVVNATTIHKGGGIQAAVAFIRILIEEVEDGEGLTWAFAVSAEVRDQLASYGHGLRAGKDVCVEISPSKNRKSRKVLRAYVNTHADVVFTFFGPSYVRFQCPHLCGVADGWVTHSNFLAYSTLPTLGEKLTKFLSCIYKGLWFRTADHFVVEQEAARQGLVKRLRLSPKFVHVVQNNCGQAYLDWKPKKPEILPSTVRILCFATYYPHKCLELIPDVAKFLIEEENITDCTFVLTLPQEIYSGSRIEQRANALGVEHAVENVGYVPLRDGPALYERCDISFLPSVLETFSATYPESMCMGLPIVTSDLHFARSVCGDAALYFEPKSARSAAGQIAKLIHHDALRHQQIQAGFERMRQFPSPREKYEGYREILHQLLAET